jgi:hypothetical protein
MPADKTLRIQALIVLIINRIKSEIILNDSYYLVNRNFDLNIIILLLVTAFKLIPFAITQTRRLVLYIRTEDSNSFPLAKYIKFKFSCRGIWHIIYTFISPDSKNKGKHLLLGLPCFYSIRVILDIPASII